MSDIILYPSFRKRLLLIAIVVAFATAVAIFTRFPSSQFILYFGICCVTFVYLVIRLFNREPILILSNKGILSRMTINGRKIGLVSWADVTEIRDTRMFWFIKGVELHATESVAQKYQTVLSDKYKPAQKTFLLNLNTDEINMSHSELLALVEKNWKLYRTVM